MFAAKWHLKPHRDAFKTIISHESLVMYAYRESDVKNRDRAVDRMILVFWDEIGE